jgi:hypothetical protein
MPSQNINFQQLTDLNSTLIGSINSWYNGFSTVTQADVDSSPMTSNPFLTMMHDRITAMGCAMVKTTYQIHFKFALLTCNYGFRTTPRTPVYAKGTSASLCPQADSTYPSLCAIPPPQITTPPTFDPTTVKPASEYCNLCTNHTVCINNGNWYSACPPDRKIVPISNAVRDSILYAHNYYRNKVAGGGEPGFNSAVKMNKLVRFFGNLNSF